MLTSLIPTLFVLSVLVVIGTTEPMTASRMRMRITLLRMATRIMVATFIVYSWKARPKRTFCFIYITIDRHIAGHPPFLGSGELKLSQLNALSRETETHEDKQRMKRIGQLWNKVTETENGIQAVIEGTRHKRGDRVVRKLLYDDEIILADKTKLGQIDPKKAEEFVEPIIEALKDKTWRHSKPRYKRQFCRNRASSKGKWRDLYIPTLEDHTVHHMIMSIYMKAFTRGMHPHCCGSVPGRGINHVVKFVEHWMKRDLQCRYFVKLDIRHFFDSIDRDVLLKILKRKIKDREAIYVFKRIIDSSPSPCPVGYYTSPWLANLYLQDFDWFVDQQFYKIRRGKRIKYVRHYLRYVDDILLIGTSKHDLEMTIKEIKRYLQKNLHLEIKDSWEIKQIGKHETADGKWILKPGTYWCDIGGYKFCKDATIMRDGVYLSTSRLAKTMSKQKHYTVHQCASLNAKLGWAKHSNSFNYVTNFIRPYVHIKVTRRIISDVGKKRKWRELKTAKDRILRKQCNTSPKLSAC